MGAELKIEGPLILVSNRGPVEYTLEEDGSLGVSRGAGGLVTALSGLTAKLGGECVWVCSAMSEGDVQVARDRGDQRLRVEEEGHPRQIRMVVSEPEAYQRFYSVIANPLL
ncbi:MAG TPA: hypothetical protein VE152_13750, partial [Acidimicrobiales bacterium]|nr:hypothetical protein [Acidimicrobiales bacterium]